MMYRTSMYAVHEYQTSKAGVIIESILLPLGPGEARPLNVLSAFYCALLCLMDELKRSLFNKSTTIGICSPKM